MVAVTVPKGASSGTTLRLKGRGLPLKGGAQSQRGDQYVKLKIVLPEKPNSALEKLIEGWVKSNKYDVRSEEHTSELQSIMRISYAVFCLKKKHNIIQ